MPSTTIQRPNRNVSLSSDAVTAKVMQPIVEAATQSSSTLLDKLLTTRNGLSRDNALVRLEREGFNEIATERPPAWYVQFLHAFHTPFTYLLLTLAIISFFTHDLPATIVIAVMVAISGLLRYWQEYRSGRAAEKLRAMVHITATVFRPTTRMDKLDNEHGII